MKPKYKVEYHLKSSDKRGERGYSRILSRNGETIYASEKHKNWRAGKRVAIKAANDLSGAEFVFIDHRKKKSKLISN